MHRLPEEAFDILWACPFKCGHVRAEGGEVHVVTGLTHSHELMEEQVLFCHTHTQTPVIVNTLYTFTDSRQSNSCSVTYTQTQVVVTIYHTFSNSGTAGLGLSHTQRHQSLLPPITPSLTQVQQILFCHTQTHTHTHRHTHTHTHRAKH